MIYTYIVIIQISSTTYQAVFGHIKPSNLFQFSHSSHSDGIASDDRFFKDNNGSM